MKRNLTVRQDGTQVLLLLDGGLIAELPWQAADQLGRAVLAQARRAEEWANAARIAQDQALLLRAGVPLGLTSHAKIQAEAAHHAAWDRNLRRYLPGGVQSQEHFGTPAVIRHAPRGATA